MPGRDQFTLTPEWLWSWAGSQQSPAPQAQEVLPSWDAEGTGSQLSRDLTTALLLQGKGRRESEGPKSCRRPSGRSPTRAEKRMSFESISSFPEVSGRQAGGAGAEVSGARPDLRVCRRGFQAGALP